MKVFVVSTAPDYYLEAVALFTTLKKARNFVAKTLTNKEEWWIQEVTLDSTADWKSVEDSKSKKK